MVGVAVGAGAAGSAAASGVTAGVGSVVGGLFSGIGSLFGGSKAASAAKTAAWDEAQLALAAQQQQVKVQEASVSEAQPYINYGTTAGNQLISDLQSGALGQPAPTDQSQIANMPGYQFTLQQGLLGTQNAQAAQGLGVSGSALKAAAGYATGLAATNYQNYFNDYWSNQNNRYNMLANTMNTGATATANLNNALTSSSNSEASNLNTAGANIGAATTTAGTDTGNAISSATSSLGSGISNALLANALLGQTQGGSTLTTTSNPQSSTNQYGTMTTYGSSRGS